MSRSGIYEIVNLVNGKRYVGSAANIDLRWRQHINGLNARRHVNNHLQASWSKHGKDAFAFVVLELCNAKNLVGREQHYIDATRPEFNFAPAAGSTLGIKFTDEARAKMSTTRRGMKFTAEHRANLSASHKGKKLSAEAHAKLLNAALSAREVNAAEYREKLRAAMIGRKFSDETRAKMSAAKLGIGFMLGKKHSPEARAKMSRAAKARCEARRHPD